MVNIGPIQPKGGTTELIFCLGLTAWQISLKIGGNVEGIFSKYLDKNNRVWPQDGAIVTQNAQKCPKLNLALWPFLLMKTLQIFCMHST